MEYEPLETSGRLSMSYQGSNIDLSTHAVIQINLQAIIDKVSIGLLVSAGYLDGDRYPPRNPLSVSRRIPLNYTRLVRGEVAAANTGSYFQEISFSIASVIASQEGQAILLNLASNVIWAISTSGVRGVISRFRSPPPNRNEGWARRNDPFDIGPNVRDMVIAIAQERPNDEIRVAFRETQAEDREVVVTVNSRSR
jgi:hypothetical protein